MIKHLTSNTSYFIVCEATFFGPYVNIISLLTNKVNKCWIVSIYLTWFVRRPDDGHIKTETCSLTHSKIWCVWRTIFYHFKRGLITPHQVKIVFPNTCYTNYHLPVTAQQYFKCITFLNVRSPVIFLQNGSVSCDSYNKQLESSKLTTTGLSLRSSHFWEVMQRWFLVI